jgi:hypothetical protein
MKMRTVSSFALLLLFLFVSVAFFSDSHDIIFNLTLTSVVTDIPEDRNVAWIRHSNLVSEKS